MVCIVYPVGKYGSEKVIAAYVTNQGGEANDKQLHKGQAGSRVLLNALGLAPGFFTSP